ncbi:Protein N-acetyltransferase, RimJ/RimL family [Arthrobacter alpinus]|uniref:Protein N-acetyltransferase, RimJ/RimL family n=1 Tax=Arthrobacter alpinus TaxID=656366 RepID=A0A1H5L4H0_9MICC|nr:GNAT family protein [Arthrobacter alpinus]SEE71864.1 Protein N-acetyltransferase, RimJ/RimL family [Arthrobacter alpinus]
MISEAELWPPFDLQLATPRLLLRPVRDEDLPAMVQAALSGIHPVDAMPFSFPWTQAPAHELPANTARHVWRTRAEMTKEQWSIQLGIWHAGEFIGCQDLGANNFQALHTVTTGSWLRQSAQGHGFGKEMRTAVLSYAFDWLGAQVAETEAAVWNSASLGVSRSLGYTQNGVFRHSWEPGKVTEVQQLRLAPTDFLRPDWTVTVTGSDATAAHLGIVPVRSAGHSPSHHG